MTRKVETLLQLSGIRLPVRSDESISVSIKPISEASGMSRTINGELIRVSRTVFDKMAISIAADGLNAAPLSHLSIGAYMEVALADPVYLPIASDSRTASYGRAVLDVQAWDASNSRVPPTSTPPSPLPLQTSFSAARVAALRTPVTIPFATPVAAVRARPVLACRVIGWSVDNEDANKSASWELELEEV